MLSTRNMGFVLFTLVLLVAAGGPILQVIEYSLDRSNTAASQIVAVPFVTAGLLWLRRRSVFSDIGFSVGAGLALMLPGIVVLVLSRSLLSGLSVPDILSVATVGVLVTWLGGFLLFYGPKAFRSGMFPLLFLALCIPIPAVVEAWMVEVLRRGSAEMAYVMLKLSGTPVFRDEYVFALPGLVIEIAPECSGIRSGIGMMMTGLLAGNVMLNSWWRRVALLLAAFPLLLLKNAIRIDALSLLSVHVDPNIIEGRLHHEGGVVFFAIGLVMLYPVLIWLMKSETTAVGESAGV